MIIEVGWYIDVSLKHNILKFKHKHNIHNLIQLIQVITLQFILFIEFVFKKVFKV